MIILPPDEILDYIECDEHGKWICSDNIPVEYMPIFENFIKEAESVMENKLAVFNEARREFG